MACKALDGQVAVPTDKDLAALLDRYVCVRIVQMWSTDLSRFEFDGALTWAVFLLHAEGTIYGRYGSRSAYGESSQLEMSVSGFKETLRGGLALHKRYVADPRAVGRELAGKSGPKPVWTVPEAIPSLKEKGRFAARFGGEGGHRGSCIHCHMIPVNELVSLRAAKKPMPDRKFWPFPMPDQIGLSMDPTEMALVLHVEPGSLAARAGFKGEDRLLRLNRQPILSTADIQWVLHNAGDPQVLPVEVERAGDRKRLQLSLDKGWRLRISEWRFINGALLRHTVGFNCVTVSAEERAGVGLRIQRVDPRRAGGLRRGDLIVAVDGKRDPMNLGALTAYVFRKKAPGDTLTLTLRRSGEEKNLEVTVR